VTKEFADVDARSSKSWEDTRNYPSRYGYQQPEQENTGIQRGLLEAGNVAGIEPNQRLNDRERE
jgi:hypothetical protein